MAADYSPDTCPVVIEARRARRRAAELGIKTSKGVLLYVAERLESLSAEHLRSGYERLSQNLRDAAAECIAIAGMEP